MKGISLIYIIIVLFSAGSAFYGLLHILRQLRVSWRLTLSLALLLALLSGGHQFLLSYGNYHDLSVIHPLLYLTAFAANFGIFALPLALVIDIMLSILRLAKGPILTRPPLIYLRKIYGACALIFISICSVVALIFAQALPQFDRQDIYIVNLHPDLEGLTIAQVSDVHTSPFFTAARSESIVQELMQAKPDLIVFTGDQVDGNPSQRGKDMLPFTKLQAPLGVYYIAGNHEYITGMGEWQRWYQAHGLNLLINVHARAQVGSAQLSIVGLDDAQALRAGERGFNGPNIEQALSGLADDDFRLLLAHQPRGAQQYADPRFGIDLMLSGHTHGGQVPLLNVLTGAANQGLHAGLYHLGKMQLYVSEGAGLWQGFCARLGTQSQINLFTLKRAH